MWDFYLLCAYGELILNFSDIYRGNSPVIRFTVLNENSMMMSMGEIFPMFVFAVLWWYYGDRCVVTF